MTTEEMRQLIKRMAHAIENVLEGAEVDDGIVSVRALYRLDELYEQDIRPLGPSRMPEITDLNGTTSVAEPDSSPS